MCVQDAVNDRPIKWNLMVKTKQADYPESFLHNCTPTIFVLLLRYPCLDLAAGSGGGEVADGKPEARYRRRK